MGEGNAAERIEPVFIVLQSWRTGRSNHAESRQQRKDPKYVKKAMAQIALTRREKISKMVLSTFVHVWPLKSAATLEKKNEPQRFQMSTHPRILGNPKPPGFDRPYP